MAMERGQVRLGLGIFSITWKFISSYWRSSPPTEKSVLIFVYKHDLLDEIIVRGCHRTEKPHEILGQRKGPHTNVIPGGSVIPAGPSPHQNFIFLYIFKHHLHHQNRSKLAIQIFCRHVVYICPIPPHLEHLICRRIGGKTGSVGSTQGSRVGVVSDIYLTLLPSLLLVLVVRSGTSVKLPILDICFFDFALFFVCFRFPSRKRLISSRIKTCSWTSLTDIL